MAVFLLACFTFGRREADIALTVRFLDVGQGDAVLISQGSLQVLIDGGKESKRLLELLGLYMPFWDNTVDIVVATHPDEDHVGGFLGLFDRYRIGTMLKTREPSDSKMFAQLSEILQNTKTVETFAPISVVFPNGARLETVYPDRTIDPEKNIPTNDTSVVMRLTYGKHSFLFTGDFPSTEEGKVIFDDTEILKVSHHGSKNATTDFFLGESTPEMAIVSVGKENRYGHPASELLDRLKNRGISVLRTDESGTITLTCGSSENEKCEIVTEK